MSGGRAVVELLKAEGVVHLRDRRLDVPRRARCPLRRPSVEYINVRHEQAAAFMADGLARVTGLPGVCLVTSGPGATNLVPASPRPTWRTRPWWPWSAASRSATGQGRLPGARPGRDVPAGDQAGHAGQPGRAHSRCSCAGAAHGDDGRARPRVRRDPARRAERSGGRRRAPLAPEALPRDPSRCRRTPRRSARRRACCAQAQRPLLIVGGGVTWAGASDLGRAAQRAVTASP